MKNDVATVENLLAGTVAAAGRFVPVPLIDDVAREQMAKLVVWRAVRRAGIDQPLDYLAPLYTIDGSATRSVGALLRKAAVGIATFPVRRIARILRAARGTPRDFLRPVLLGEATEHAIEEGLFDGGPDICLEEAKEARVAFELALRSVDDELFRRAWVSLSQLARPGASGHLEDEPLKGLDTLLADFRMRFDSALVRSVVAPEETEASLEYEDDLAELRGEIDMGTPPPLH